MSEVPDNVAIRVTYRTQTGKSGDVYYHLECAREPMPWRAPLASPVLLAKVEGEECFNCGRGLRSRAEPRREGASSSMRKLEMMESAKATPPGLRAKITPPESGEYTPSRSVEKEEV